MNVGWLRADAAHGRLRREPGLIVSRMCLVFILFGLGSATFADTSPLIPHTAAGRKLGLWLDSFNSGERTRIEAFRRAHASWVDLDWLMKARAVTGGYELLTVESSQPTDIIVRMKEKTSGNETIGRIQVTASEPLEVTELGLFLIPAGAKFTAVALDPTERARVIDSVARMLDESYVFPKVGRDMAAGVRERQKRGEYDTVVDGEDFARKLTADLQDISHDKHVKVRFSFVAQPADMFTKPAADNPALRNQLLASNCGFEKSEHLPPNIGYLKFNMFADPEICSAAATTALTSLADTDALILDLRDNNGGMTWHISRLSRPCRRRLSGSARSRRRGAGPGCRARCARSSEKPPRRCS